MEEAEGAEDIHGLRKLSRSCYSVPGQASYEKAVGNPSFHFRQTSSRSFSDSWADGLGYGQYSQTS